MALTAIFGTFKSQHHGSKPQFDFRERRASAQPRADSFLRGAIRGWGSTKPVRLESKGRKRYDFRGETRVVEISIVRRLCSFSNS